LKRNLLFTSLLLGLSFAHADTLTTPSFTVEITVNCEEGSVTCDDVAYVGTSKKTGKSIKLHGRTKHTTCADGVTPCRFLGYEFRNGKIYYHVLEDGTLLVVQGKKTLLSEKGEWQ